MTIKRAGRTHLVTAASVVLTLSPRSSLLEILASLGQGLLELHDLLDLLLPGQLGLTTGGSGHLDLAPVQRRPRGDPRPRPVRPHWQAAGVQAGTGLLHHPDKTL